jgi:hypothetical protein
MRFGVNISTFHFVENTELHIGPRPKNSIYSGKQHGKILKKKKNLNRLFPKLWYGWIGTKIMAIRKQF